MLIGLLVGFQAYSQVPLSYGFDHPQDSARTKIWWFHGNTETTLSGITADLEAFKAQGIGGVVYYDQVHAARGLPQTRVCNGWWPLNAWLLVEETFLSRCRFMREEKTSIVTSLLLPFHSTKLL